METQLRSLYKMHLTSNGFYCTIWETLPIFVHFCHFTLQSFDSSFLEAMCGIGKGHLAVSKVSKQGSTASNGCYSDIGLSDHPVEDAHSSANNAGGPLKHHDEHAISSNNDRTALNSSKRPACEKCFKGPPSSSQYENYEPPNACHTPPVPPKSVNKVPLYENITASHHKGTSEAEAIKTDR